MANGTEQVRIHMRQWTYLPDTEYDVLLHGKPITGFGSTGAMLIDRNGDHSDPFAGWVIPLNCCFVRKTRDYGVPDPMSDEAFRDLIGRPRTRDAAVRMDLTGELATLERVYS